MAWKAKFPSSRHSGVFGLGAPNTQGNCLVCLDAGLLRHQESQVGVSVFLRGLDLNHLEIAPSTREKRTPYQIARACKSNQDQLRQGDPAQALHCLFTGV